MREPIRFTFPSTGSPFGIRAPDGDIDELVRCWTRHAGSAAGDVEPRNEASDDEILAQLDHMLAASQDKMIAVDDGDGVAMRSLKELIDEVDAEIAGAEVIEARATSILKNSE